MTELNITCAYCGGTDFTLHITLSNSTVLRCVDHREHTEDLDLDGQRAVQRTLRKVEDQWPDDPTPDTSDTESADTDPPVPDSPRPSWIQRVTRKVFGEGQGA